MFWPSFNGALHFNSPLTQHRSFINTLISISGSTFVAFLTSHILNDRYDIVDIQNATLAGGVGIGCLADFNLNVYGALLVGCIAGFVSTLCFNKLTHWLKKKFNYYDTC